MTRQKQRARTTPYQHAGACVAVTICFCILRILTVEFPGHDPLHGANFRRISAANNNKRLVVPRNRQLWLSTGPRPVTFHAPALQMTASRCNPARGSGSPHHLPSARIFLDVLSCVASAASGRPTSATPTQTTRAAARPADVVLVDVAMAGLVGRSASTDSVSRAAVSSAFEAYFAALAAAQGHRVLAVLGGGIDAIAYGENLKAWTDNGKGGKPPQVRIRDFAGSPRPPQGPGSSAFGVGRGSRQPVPESMATVGGAAAAARRRAMQDARTQISLSSARMSFKGLASGDALAAAAAEASGLPGGRLPLLRFSDSVLSSLEPLKNGDGDGGGQQRVVLRLDLCSVCTSSSGTVDTGMNATRKSGAGPGQCQSCPEVREAETEVIRAFTSLLPALRLIHNLEAIVVNLCVFPSPAPTPAASDRSHNVYRAAASFVEGVAAAAESDQFKLVRPPPLRGLDPSVLTAVGGKGKSPRTLAVGRLFRTIEAADFEAYAVTGEEKVPPRQELHRASPLVGPLSAADLFRLVEIVEAGSRRPARGERGEGRAAAQKGSSSETYYRGVPPRAFYFGHTEPSRDDNNLEDATSTSDTDDTPQLPDLDLLEYSEAVVFLPAKSEFLLRREDDATHGRKRMARRTKSRKTRKKKQEVNANGNENGPLAALSAAVAAQKQSAGAVAACLRSKYYTYFDDEERKQQQQRAEAQQQASQE